jgi:hypothetical protein
MGHLVRTLKRARRTALIVLGVLCGACLYVSTWLPADPGFRAIAIGLPLALVVFAMLLVPLGLLLPGRLHSRQVDFSDDGLVSTYRGRTQYFPWSAVREVADGLDAIDLVIHFERRTVMVVDKRTVAPEVVATLSGMLRRCCPDKFRG